MKIDIVVSGVRGAGKSHFLRNFNHWLHNEYYVTSWEDIIMPLENTIPKEQVHIEFEIDKIK